MNYIQLLFDAYGQLPGKTKLILWSLFSMGLLIRILRRPKFKGRRGERITSIALFRNLPDDEYTILNDVTLPSGEGTTQIDHIVVSPYGIFCVETKHMKGWIYGSEKKATWTQVIYKKKTQFQNPLRQNYKHTETLRARLNLPKEAVHSVVAFTGEATLKTQMPPHVGSTKTCLNYIRSFNTPVFSQAEVKRFLNAIESGGLEPTRATNRLHVQNLRADHSGASKTPVDISEEETEVPTCPECGNPMILRTARKGANAGKQFWGCSTFPKCRKTLQSTA